VDWWTAIGGGEFHDRSCVKDSHTPDPVLVVFFDAAVAEEVVYEEAAGFFDDVAGAALADPTGSGWIAIRFLFHDSKIFSCRFVFRLRRTF
jgi:hypothetical protein